MGWRRVQFTSRWPCLGSSVREMCLARGCSLESIWARCVPSEAVVLPKWVRDVRSRLYCLPNVCTRCVSVVSVAMTHVCSRCVSVVSVAMKHGWRGHFSPAASKYQLAVPLKHYNIALFIIQLTVDKLHMQLIKLLSVNMRKGFDSVGDSNWIILSEKKYFTHQLAQVLVKYRNIYYDIRSTSLIIYKKNNDLQLFRKWFAVDICYWWLTLWH